MFNNLVNSYITTNNKESKKKIVALLQVWVSNHQLFMEIKNTNHILKSVEPLSLNLTDISKTLISILETENIKTSNGQNIVFQFLRIKESRC